MAKNIMKKQKIKLEKKEQVKILQRNIKKKQKKKCFSLGDDSDYELIGKGDCEVEEENEKKSELLKKAQELIDKAQELKEEANKL